MRNTQSDFIKIQPFMQTLRPSLHSHKQSFTDSITSNPTINSDVLTFNPKDKSLSKSKIMRVIRKTSVGTARKQSEKYPPEANYHQNQLLINFNKICTTNLLSESIKGLENSRLGQASFDVRELKISVIFSKIPPINLNFNPKPIANFFTDQKNQKTSPKPEITKIKLEITCFELSIEDESKVKRIFDINLTETLVNKQFLKIQFSDGLKPETIILNNKLVIPKEQPTLPDHEEEKIDVIKPWDLANQRKSILKDKILSQRPKSKIKWSFSLTESCDTLDKSDYQCEKFSQIQENYGLKASNESSLKFSLELNNRSKLTLNMPKQNPYMNVFMPNGKDEVSSISMKSTFDSDERSNKKEQLNGSGEMKRVNNIVGSLNFKSKKLVIKQEQQGSQKPLRPKSSFKSLKQKNDYFMMKESERKRSMKKSMGSLLEGENSKIEMKSNDVKEEYGIE